MAKLDKVETDNRDADGDEDEYSYLEELTHEKDARKRSGYCICYRFFYIISTSVWFNFFIFCLIIANAITLAIYTYD